MRIVLNVSITDLTTEALAIAQIDELRQDRKPQVPGRVSCFRATSIDMLFTQLMIDQVF